jgi:hypothetical protein
VNEIKKVVNTRQDFSQGGQLTPRFSESNKVKVKIRINFSKKKLKKQYRKVKSLNL